MLTIRKIMSWYFLPASVLSAVVVTSPACTKSKPAPSVQQDVFTVDMTPHDFVTNGYSILNGSWGGADFKGHPLNDKEFPIDNFLRFDVKQKHLQFYYLEGEARNLTKANPTTEDPSKTESFLAELLNSEPAVNSERALISFLRLGDLGRHYENSNPKLAKLPFTIVTNRDELPYSPKPQSGPEWNQFIRDYCGGFQNPQLGFLWLDAHRKYCLKVWTGKNRQIIRLRALVTLPGSRTSSALDARVSPWIVFTRTQSSPQKQDSTKEPVSSNLDPEDTAKR